MSDLHTTTTAAGQGLLQAASQLLSRLDAPELVAVLDEMPVGLVVVDTGRRVRFLNRRLEAMVGRPREDCQGLPCGQVLRAAVCMRRCPALQPGGETVSLETDLLAKSRRQLPVRLTSICLRDAAGEPLGHLETFEDLTPLKELERRAAGAGGDERLQWRSPEMEKVVQLIPMLAESDAPVFITGETGTGKDLLAEVLHGVSRRAREPFVRVNLGSLPEVQLESELFGSLRGALPWAQSDRPGRFQAAGTGTVYLAEVTDLPAALQAKLVRLLDEGSLTPLGGDTPVRLRARIIAATHQDPEQLAKSGRLREDLLHRLGALRVHLPPLRERQGDVEFLLQHFLAFYAGRLRKDIPGFGHKAKATLLGHPYPGNVRELMNIVEYAVMVCPRGEILPAHLPMHIFGPASVRRAAARAAKAGEGKA